MKIRATAAIMECLLEQEVDTVFGYPGGTILNLYDELYNYKDKIHHVLTAHEQGASHAADGYARSTGKVGVCFATSGPGATNLVTGIATAYMDSSPIVFITCNVTEQTLGKDAFQEVDITGIAMPITKATYLVRDAQTIPDVMRQAFAVAATGRPGPVVIDFLKNVTFPNVEIDYEFVPWTENRKCGSLRSLSTSHDLKAPEPNIGDINTLVDMIAQSEKPLLICGGGVVRGRADREFRALAEKLDKVIERLDSLQPNREERPLSDETAIDGAIARLSGGEPAVSATVPGGEAPEAASGDGALELLKRLRPAVAGIRDRAERARVVDAVLDSLKSPGITEQINRAAASSARKAADAAVKPDYQTICEAQQAEYYARNPHKNKEA